MSKKSFLIDADKCTNCKLCVIACKDEHVDSTYAPWSLPQPEAGQFWMDVKAIERGHTPRVRMSHLPVLCQHCENAPCIKSCPDDAILRRDDGLVWIDPAACTGCGMCIEACPYDVVFMNDDLGVAQKCTGCAHRVDAGELPRCADVCPHGAILFGDEDDAVFADDSDGRPIEIFHPEFEAAPRVLWKGLPKPWIAATVIDAASDEVIEDAEATATDLIGDAARTVRTDAFGDFWVNGLDMDRKYRVEIAKPGYQPFVAVVTTDDDCDLGTVALVPAS